MNMLEWKQATEAIHDAFYEGLVGTAECGPFDGGCVVVAQALQMVIGGDIVVVVRPDDRADHAAVLKDGQLWDYDGPLPPVRFIDRFNRTELSASPWKCVGYRPLRAGDLKNAYRDDDLVARLAALFHQALNGRDAELPPHPGLP
jgi:hypothetical protein